MKNKFLLVLCILGTSLLATTNVFARASAIAINGVDGKVYEYDYCGLKTSTVAYIVSGESDPESELYIDFLTRKADKNGIKAYYDDVRKAYVDFDVISEAAVNAVLIGKKFDLNKFLEDLSTPTISDINVTKPYIVEKPNIYLYPEKTEELSVDVTPKGKITKSIPEYNKGWKVTVDPSGKIDNTYDFLFYEASINYQFTLDKGWIVDKDSFNEEMNNILTSIGLNSKEKADFIEYWSKRLNWQSRRYAAYYLDTKEINEAIRLNLSKEPDSILRAFFCFVPLNDNENLEIKEPEIKEFKRNGFTVVEWGGIGK